MNKILYTALAFAVLGLAASADGALAAQKNGVNNNGNNLNWDCFTDDGYGRKLPCDYGYQKRAARNNGIKRR